VAGLTRRALLLAAGAGALAPVAALAAPYVAPLLASEALAEAAVHLGQRYVYGGVRPGQFDCSSYVCWAWRIPRRTTDTIGPYVREIDKDDLRPGDAMNRPLAGRLGHIRIFDGWAEPGQRLVWVYEAVRRYGVVHQVVPYSDRYVPVRRLSMIADVPLPEPKLPADYEIPNGRFYTQAAGQDGLIGFTITNEVGVRLFNEYWRLGGAEKLGVPTTGRFEANGFVLQATEHGMLRWDPKDGRAEFVESHEELEHAGEAAEPRRSPVLEA